MTRPAVTQPTGQENAARFTDAVTRELARAPRRIAPEDAAAIGGLIGPLPSQQQEGTAA
jgi:hypothetical protein